MPWGISHKHEFIFIHIPKTAGTTICSSWEGSVLKHICKEHGILGGTHKSAMQIKSEYPTEWRNYFKFCVIRNPFDRFVSKFFYKQLNPRKDFNLEWTDKESEGLLPQVYWITDREYIRNHRDPYDRPDSRYGNIIVDRMIRYEDLNTELPNVLNSLGLSDVGGVIPHFRQTRMVGDFERYYTPEMKALVRYMYREDFKRLGYDW